MTKTCFFFGCKNNSLKNPDLEFVPFVKPYSDFKRCKQWIALCKRSVPVDKIRKHTYICSDHFGLNEVLDWKINPNLIPVPLHRLKTVNREDLFPKNLLDTDPLYTGLRICERNLENTFLMLLFIL